MQRRWIVAGDQVGLTAPVREEFIARWDAYNDPELAMLISFPSVRPTGGALTKPPMTRDAREQTWEMLVETGVHLFDIRAIDDQRLIGEASLSKITWPRASADLAIAIFDAEDRGRGLGTEAVMLMVAYGFDGLGLHRVSMRYLAANEAVVGAVDRSAESVGGRVVGVEREAEWAFGGWQDTILVEILAKDFPPHPATARLRQAPTRFELQS